MARAPPASGSDSTLEPLVVWPDVAPVDLRNIPQRYLERYQARLKEQITRLQRELDEYRQILKLEYRTECARRRRRRKS